MPPLFSPTHDYSLVTTFHRLYLSVVQVRSLAHFYRTTLWYSAVWAVALCLPVRLSVCHKF